MKICYLHLVQHFIPATRKPVRFHPGWRGWALGLFLLAAFPAAAADVTIGVLALRGPEKTLEMWSATGAYLERKLPGHSFRIVPLDFDEIQLAARQRKVDFILANPAYYVELEALYGASPIATLKNRHDGGSGYYGVFGGVIFARADRKDLRSVADLKGKTFAAVDKNSFGGWLAAWREMKRQGLDPETGLARLDFLGTHDAVVYAVRNGKVDAGTVRTETLERMAAEGKIKLSDFYVLNERREESFPLRLSTPLYPEWPLAKLPQVSADLAVKVAVALMQMPAGDPAAIASHSAGWTLPLNYQPVHDALKELRIGPYEHLRHISTGEMLEQYWQWALSALALTLMAFWAAAHAGRMNRRLRQSQRALGELNVSLERRVQERTGHVNQLLAREHYLRGIVEMVADVNQILITAGSMEEMLKGCCDRLIAHAEYRFAWVILLRNDRLELAANSYGEAEFVKKAQVRMEEGPGGQAVRDNKTVIVNLAGQRPEGVSGPDGSSAVCLPLRKDAFAEPLGALCVLTVRARQFDREEVAMLEQLAGDIGFAVHAFRQQTETLRLQQDKIDNYEETILSLVDMVEKRDPYTAGHTRRVAQYCGLIAAQLGHGPDEIETLKRAAILHDIGKITIPDAVLLKPGKLTTLEYDLIKQHVEVGYDTLTRIEMYKELAEIMRDHHERLDGSGYPRGLKNGQIPRLSQIMALADAFDAMTSSRIYKARKAVDVALEELRQLAGEHYDPEVVAAGTEALRHVEPPSSADQLPKTPLELQRFAYFFDDQLTKLHNANYLQFMLQKGLLQGYAWASVILLRHFSGFNVAQGWKAGDRLLADFAAYLAANYPDTLIFRVMGDDFVLCSRTQKDIDGGRLKTHSPLCNTPVDVDVQEISLNAEGGEERLRALL
ncbi:MAG: PhnD/SsuA/transferrin family substrate-binding protein [Sulfuricella sp.]